MRSAREARGQATVELVALLPVLVLVAAGVWQAALAGYAAWSAAGAARAAARAHAVGADPARAAREHLPPALEQGLHVVSSEGGGVRVSIRVPRAPGMPTLGSVSAAARFEDQA